MKNAKWYLSLVFFKIVLTVIILSFNSLWAQIKVAKQCTSEIKNYREKENLISSYFSKKIEKNKNIIKERNNEIVYIPTQFHFHNNFDDGNLPDDFKYDLDTDTFNTVSFVENKVADLAKFVIETNFYLEGKTPNPYGSKDVPIMLKYADKIVDTKIRLCLLRKNYSTEITDLDNTTNHYMTSASDNHLYDEEKKLSFLDVWLSPNTFDAKGSSIFPASYFDNGIVDYVLDFDRKYGSINEFNKFLEQKSMRIWLRSVVQPKRIGGGFVPRIFAHEIGHTLGLFHIFEGDCGSVGDAIPETPPESSYYLYNQLSRDNVLRGALNDSCPHDSFPDMYTNAMDYSGKEIGFVQEQANIMHSILKSDYGHAPSEEVIQDICLSPIELMELASSNEPSKKLPLHIYPNPLAVNQVLKINLPLVWQNYGSVYVALYDVNSREIYKKRIEIETSDRIILLNTVEIPNLSSGPYVIKLMKENELIPFAISSLMIVNL